jgi:hypothetical protein
MDLQQLLQDLINIKKQIKELQNKACQIESEVKNHPDYSSNTLSQIQIQEEQGESNKKIKQEKKT